MYKLYTDKSKTFTCNVDIEGAALNESEARIILETRGMNILYNGKIYSDGTCEIEIDKMKFLPEDTKGKIKLEIIAESTLFTPWESDFVVETEKKVKITEVKEDITKDKKRNNIKVIVEVDESKNLNTKKLNEHIAFLKNYAIKNRLKNDIGKDEFFESYQRVLSKKKISLNENEINYIKDSLKKMVL